MQFITLADVRSAALAAYHAKTLTAQSPNWHERSCVFKGKSGRTCAVGAAFNSETLERCPIGDVVTLCNRGSVHVPMQDIAAIVAIQSAYDDWCSERRFLGRHDIDQSRLEGELEARFLRLIEG